MILAKNNINEYEFFMNENQFIDRNIREFKAFDLDARAKNHIFFAVELVMGVRHNDNIFIRIEGEEMTFSEAKEFINREAYAHDMPDDVDAALDAWKDNFEDYLESNPPFE